jgi:hypothetical protein
VKGVKIFFRAAGVAIALTAAAPLAPARAQDKPPVTIAEIDACARAFSCPNMKRSALNWYDQVGIPVVAFSDEEQTFALSSGRNGLAIWVTLKGESRPSRYLSVDLDGRVVSAEMFAPGNPRPGRLTPEQTARWRKDARALIPAIGSWEPVGEEFRPFWQEQAAAALAAIRRQLARAPGFVPVG